ncbi:MAG TPA: virulence factor [Pseudobacteroides sp.]|uniref:virulence factor n=1 Tax=Pseudobacteroides sp. TaxID=1968840 RepID=UPI002F93DFE9
MVKFSQKVTGVERKGMAAIIAEATGQQVKYSGVPSYAYEIGGWSIDRDGIVYSPTFDTNQILDYKKVLDALNLPELTAEGDLCITFSTEGHNEVTLQNLSALIKSKANLLEKSLSRPAEQDWTVSLDTESEIKFTFFNATLNFDEVKAFILLAEKLSQQAKALKYCSAKEKAVENEKYAMRCFLLRLGFIGDEYKTERKILLGRLSGNAAFKSEQHSIQEVASA